MAFALVTLLAFGAISIDLSMWRMDKQELQNAADAAAHAGANVLDGTAGGMTGARDLTQDIGAMNSSRGDAVSLDANSANTSTGDIVLGSWTDSTFTPTTDPAKATAVKATAHRADLGTFFDRIAFGVDGLSVSKTATAVAGGPSSSGCPIPIAIPSCSLPTGTSVCNMDVTLGPDNNDSAAWAKIGSSRPTKPDIDNALNSNCAAASDTLDLVSLNNGAINAAMKSLADAINGSADAWDSSWGTQPAQRSRSGVSPWGRVLVGNVIVFEDPSNCTAPKMNGTSLTIKGYASAAVYEAVTTGPVAQRVIGMRVLCELSDELGGGGYYGTTVVPRILE
jgi:hypothetical protein